MVHSCKYCLDFLGSGDSLPVCCSTYQLIGITNELSDFLIATARKPPRVTADGFLIGSHFKTNFSDLLSVNNIIKGWRFQISPIMFQYSRKFYLGLPVIYHCSYLLQKSQYFSVIFNYVYFIITSAEITFELYYKSIKMREESKSNGFARTVF